MKFLTKTSLFLVGVLILESAVAQYPSGEYPSGDMGSGDMESGDMGSGDMGGGGMGGGGGTALDCPCPNPKGLLNAVSDALIKLNPDLGKTVFGLLGVSDLTNALVPLVGKIIEVLTGCPVMNAMPAGEKGALGLGALLG